MICSISVLQPWAWNDVHGERQIAKGQKGWYGLEDKGQKGWYVLEDKGQKGWYVLEDKGQKGWYVLEDKGQKGWYVLEDKGQKGWYVLEDKGQKGWYALEDKGQKGWYVLEDKGQKGWYVLEDKGQKGSKHDVRVKQKVPVALLASSIKGEEAKMKPQQIAGRVRARSYIEKWHVEGCVMCQEPCWG